MRAVRSFTAAVAVAACALAAARADVVHLTNGRRMRGEVLEETPEQVVLRTPDGRVVLPAGLVDRIERESRASLLLAQGRRAAQNGDHAQALTLLSRAIEAAEASGEAALAREARAEREALEREPPPSPAPPTGAPAWDGRGDPFVEEEREALVRELEQAVAEHPELGPRLVRLLYERGGRRHDQAECRLAASDFRRAREACPEGDPNAEPLRGLEQRCRLEVASRALRRADGALALAAVAPVVAAPIDERFGLEARYDEGRALELLRRGNEARRAFLACLEGTPASRRSDLATLRELARLRAAGIPITEETPGVGEGWRWLETKHFAILHELDPAPDGWREAFEQAWRDVVDRLDLRRLDEDGRVAVFVFADEGAYQGSDGARAWSAGHARRLRTDRDLIRAIYLYPGPDFADRLRHEVAHILVGDALDDALLPAWATEGVAIYAETEASRARRRGNAAYLHRQGALAPVPETLARMLPPLTDDYQEALAFYSQACVLFEELTASLGVERTLSCLTRFNEEGPEKALRQAGVRLDRFEARVLERLAAGAR